MYKNLKTQGVECLDNGNYHMYRKLFPAKQHFFKIDQLIAKNPKSSKQTFDLSHVTVTSIATQIKS